MPVFNYRCVSCGYKFGKMAATRNPPPCPKCGGDCRSDPTGPTAQVNEILDNGLMPRRLERLRDAERLYKERAQNDPRKRND